MKLLTTTKGYSLVEVLVAVAILMLAIVGPLTIAAKSVQSAQYARQQTTAFFLAQEGISAVNTIRNNYALEAFDDGTTNPWDWADGSGPLAECFNPQGCDIDFSDTDLLSNIADCSSANACEIHLEDDDASSDVALYSHGSGDLTPYTRVIKLDDIGTGVAEEIQVTVEVSWESHLFNSSKSVVLTTSLFNVYGQLFAP